MRGGHPRNIRLGLAPNSDDQVLGDASNVAQDFAFKRESRMETKNLTEHQESKKETMAGTDFLSAIVLMGFSAGIVVWSLKMPRFAGWSSAPGLLPFLLSISTFFMSLGLLISSIKNQGHKNLEMRYRALSWSRFIREPKTKRSLGIILLTALYVFALLDRVPFELASFIYLMITLSVYWRKGGWFRIILLSLLVPFVTSGIFRGLFVVFLPGGSFFDWVFRVIR
jgi:hypothetical protein